MLLVGFFVLGFQSDVMKPDTPGKYVSPLEGSSSPMTGISTVRIVRAVREPIAGLPWNKVAFSASFASTPGRLRSIAASVQRGFPVKGMVGSGARPASRKHPVFPVGPGRQGLPASRPKLRATGCHPDSVIPVTSPG